MALTQDIDYDDTQELPALCTRTDTWVQKIVNWVASVSGTVRDLWRQARTYFSPRQTDTPTGQSSPDKQPTFEQLVADVETLKSQVTNLMTEMRAGFQAIDGRFQQVDENFAAVKKELKQARLHRNDLMSDYRQSVDLGKNLQGFVRYIVNRTLRPTYGKSLDVEILWADGDSPRRWHRIEQDLELPLSVYANRIDRLIEIAWPVQGTAQSQSRTFLVCEATLTLDREHIAKLENACHELAAADHHVIGILGYVKDAGAILATAQATDLVLWRFTDDIGNFTEETGGHTLPTRLRNLIAQRRHGGPAS